MRLPRICARAEIRGTREGLARPLELAERRVLHGGADMALLRHRVDEAERLRPAGIDGAAGEHQRHGLQRIDQRA